MKLQLLTYLFFISHLLHAQDGIIVSGIITDSTTHALVENAFVHIERTSLSAYSDSTGRYAIQYHGSLKRIEISCTATNFITAKRRQEISGKNVRVNFELVFSSYELPSVEISDLPKVVWGSDELNVADFVFAGSSIVLLTYEKEERWKRQNESKTTLYSGGIIVVIDANGKEIYRKIIPGLVKKFYTGYLDEIILECHDKRFFVVLNEEGILLDEISDDDFEKQVLPLVDTLNSITYFSNYNENYPAFDYMMMGKNDSTYSVIRHVMDEHMMQMLRSEYKYLDPRDKLEAYRFEQNTGIDKEVIAAYMRGFQNTYYYEALNAPLLVCHDTLVLFDHHHDKLIRFDLLGNALDSSAISYHHQRKPDRWSEKVFCDDSTREVFTFSQRNGGTYISHINIHNGNAGRPSQLHYRYVENIRMKNGRAYYIYRPFESSQNRFLYSEILSEGLN